jgi:hypothetical protein
VNIIRSKSCRRICKLVPTAEFVTLEVTEEPAEEDAQPPLSTAEAIEIMRSMQRHVAARGESVTEEEAVRRVRELRDEWED